MGRIIGIDYGLKRVGIAATDPLQISVNGKGTHSPDEAFDFIVDLMDSGEVDEIIIGMPPRPGDAFLKSLETFTGRLKKRADCPPIKYHDEDFTSQDAVKVMVAAGVKKKKRREKALIDEVSAVLILQNYLGHI